MKHLFTALASDGSGDVVMAIKGNPRTIERAVKDMPSVRKVTTQGRVSNVVFKGRVDEAMGMFKIIQARARSK